MKHKIEFVDRTFKDEVDALRMSEYAKASGFSVDLSTLQWKTSDDESFVMVAREGGKLISTMRGEVIDNVGLLEKKLECPWDFPLNLDFPVLLLSRAATASSHRSAGLNLVLRYWFFHFARAHGIGAVVGTFVSGSPRENSLRAMGYQFFENKLGWQKSTYRSLRPVHVVVLNMKSDGEKAMAYCREKAGEGLETYKYEGEFPPLRIVRCL